MTINSEVRRSEFNTQMLGEREQHIMDRVRDETDRVMDMVDNASGGDPSAREEIKRHLQQLQAEQEALRSHLARQRRQLSFYGSFDKLLYDTLQQPVAQAIDMVRAIVEHAEKEAALMVEEAQRERQMILEEARLEARKIAGAARRPTTPDQPAAPAPISLPAAPASGRQIDGQAELVVSGLKSFSQAVQFQKALLAVPEINHAKVRLIQRGLVNLEVRHQPGADLPALVASLPGFVLRVVAQDPGVLTLAVEHTPAGEA